METKLRVIAEIMMALFLVTTLFPAVSVVAEEPIRVGVIGPVGWIQNAGLVEGSTLAADEINAAGGVNVGGVMRPIELVFGDEHSVPIPDPEAAATEVLRMITVDGIQFLIGGFRTETTSAIIPVAMQYRIPYLIVGSSTTALLDGVTEDYNTYKYLFRVDPINSTMLFKSIAAFLGYYVIPYKLLPIYGDYLWEGAPNPQVRVAVLTEDLAWTEEIHFYLSNPAVYPYVLGPYANVTYAARLDPTATDFTGILTGVIDSGARLMIHVVSALEGVPLIRQWYDMGVEAIPVGINVLGQMAEPGTVEWPSHWMSTDGRCEYETFLSFVGTRTPITAEAVVFWDTYVARFGHPPVYTSWGAYIAIMILKQAIEEAGTTDADTLIPYIEMTDKQTIMGKFKFTGPHPMDPADYPYLAQNPTMKGTLHDVFSNELGGEWKRGYTRALMVQWQAGRLEAVWPLDQLYSKKFAIPHWMYTLRTDVDWNGIVDTGDVTGVGYAFDTVPGDARWQFVADVDRPRDWYVGPSDHSDVSWDFGTDIRGTFPLP